MRVLESKEIVCMQGRVIIRISESLDGLIDIEIEQFCKSKVRINDPDQKDGNKYFFFWEDIIEKK